MIQKKFIEKLAIKLTVPFSEAERILKAVQNLVYERLAGGETVTWQGFGQFSVSHRRARIGVIPRPPFKRITIPELNTPKFKAGTAFKAAVKLKK